MFKKMFIIVITLTLITPFCFANNNQALNPVTSQETSNKKVIGIFLKAPATYANNEDTKKNIQKKFEEMFPANAFTVLPLDAVIAESRTYREDNKMLPDQNLTTTDIQKIAAALNCNYAFRITITNSSPRVEIEFPSVSSISDVTCDVSLLDITSGKYLTGLEIINKGKRDATFDRTASFDKQYDATLDKALKALELDVSTL